MLTGSGYVMDKSLWTLFKKHYCRDCSSKLKLTSIARYLKPGTEEFKLYAHRGYTKFVTMGDFKLKEIKFKCKKCGKVIDILDQYDYENQLKK